MPSLQTADEGCVNRELLFSILCIGQEDFFKISLHHNRLNDNWYLSDQLPHTDCVYPAEAVGWVGLL